MDLEQLKGSLRGTGLYLLPLTCTQAGLTSADITQDLGALEALSPKNALLLAIYTWI